MPRFAYRRLIVFVALLCQVVTAGIVHVPMAYAEAPAQATTAPPCHEHAQGTTAVEGDTAAAEGDTVTAEGDTVTAEGAVGAASQSSVPADHDNSQVGDHFGFCKSGVCHCTCAHSPAASSTLAFEAAFIPHPPLLLTYQVPSAPKRPTVFFRPPI